MKFEAAIEQVDLIREGCAYLRAQRDRREERPCPGGRGLFGAVTANQEAEA
jgi:hypothetical protein